MTKYPACHGSGGFAYVPREPKTAIEHFRKWPKTDVETDTGPPSIQLSDTGPVCTQYHSIFDTWALPGRMLLGICLGYYCYRYLLVSALIS